MAGFHNDTMVALNVNFGTAANSAPEVVSAGQLLIGNGSPVKPMIEAAFLTAGAGISVTNGPGAAITIANTGAGSLDITPDTGVHVTNTTYALTATTVAAGANPIRTDGTAANALQVEVQRSSSSAATNTTQQGLASFNSAQFSVDANGFVGLLGGGQAIDSIQVNSATAPGVNPVLPDVAGLLSILGLGFVSPANSFPIATHSTGVNQFYIEAQAASATVAGGNLFVPGMASFNSAQFTVDAAGWVSNINGLNISKVNVDLSTAPGTDPVVPDATGTITVNGSTPVAGGIPVKTNSLAVNSYTIEVQRSIATALSAVAANGLSHFDSTYFSVDANGFVSFPNGQAATKFGVDAFTAPGTDPVLADASGLIGISGVDMPAQAIPIQTRSNLPNDLRIEVQRASAQVASSPINAGLASFDSSQFTVDANGFVQSTASGSMAWLDTAGGALVNNTGYFVTAAAAVTLPAGVANGDTVEIVDVVGGGVVVTASGANIIQLQNVASSAGGTATSTQKGDSMRLKFRLADVTWYCVPGIGGNWILA